MNKKQLEIEVHYNSRKVYESIMQLRKSIIELQEFNYKRKKLTNTKEIVSDELLLLKKIDYDFWAGLESIFSSPDSEFLRK